MSHKDSPVNTRSKGVKSAENQNSQFEEFITKAFNDLKSELKDIQASQANIVIKLSNIEETYKQASNKLQEVDLKTTNIAKTCDFIAEKLSAIELKVKALEEKSDKLQTQMVEVETEVINLKNDLNTLERFSRRNNLRIIGFDEEKDENPLEKVKEFLEEKFQQPTVQVERAHRVGRRLANGKPRQMIVKLLSYTDKIAILRESKTCLSDTSLRIFDDLTKKDLERKITLRPIMNEVYNRGKKVRYIDGRLYIDNQLYKG